MKMSLRSLGLCLALATTALAQTYQIGITQIVEHPALDAVRNGLMDRVDERGFDVEYEYLNAQANMVTAGQIARRLIGEQPDAIVAIATPVAQAVVNGNTSVPVLFSAVTDPVGARLVESLEKPGGIATGTTDMSPVRQQVELIREILPDAQRIGIMYNAGEANSVTLVKHFREVCQDLGIQPVEGVVTNSAGVMQAAKSLVGRVDAIYIPTDNTVISAVEAVLNVSVQARLPVFCADTDSVAKGALAALSVDYYKLGEQTGDMLIRILQGANPESMPVEMLEDNELHINLKYADDMGVHFPQSVLDRAQKIHQ